MRDHGEMLDAHRAMQDDRRAAMGAFGAQALEGLHGDRDEASRVLGKIYRRQGHLEVPRTVKEARRMEVAIEAPRGHERGRGSDELVYRSILSIIYGC